MLGQIRQAEDEVIAFDKGRFPGLGRVLSESPRIKTFEHNGSKLEIIHANRNDLEKTLGVDLIYVSHYFNSFIGIQYKMLEGDKNQSKFSPNFKFRSQIKTMDKVRSKLASATTPSTQLAYRLNGTPFFFKFVARIETNFSAEALCPGMYLPVDLVKQIINSKSEKISYPQGTRHLSNSEFAVLFRQGWIGTQGGDMGILKDTIESALSKRRSLLVAVDCRSSPKERGRKKSARPLS